MYVVVRVSKNTWCWGVCLLSNPPPIDGKTPVYFCWCITACCGRFRAHHIPSRINFTGPIFVSSLCLRPSLLPRSRQLLDYQLLSDLSSDEENTSHRESNHTHAARLLESRSRSQSPRSPPLPPSPPSGPASADSERARSNRKRDVAVAPAVAPPGNDGVGVMKVSAAPGAVSDTSAAVDAPSSATGSGAGGSESGGGEDEKGRRGCSEGDYDRENEEGGDGDEEDNAADAEGYDTAGEDGVGSGGVGADGASREARVGEEGSWWWSWTWGALPVRCGRVTPCVNPMLMRVSKGRGQGAGETKGKMIIFYGR